MSQSITEGKLMFYPRSVMSLRGFLLKVYGEFRTGKTQLAHTMSVVAQLPVDLGGASGKVTCHLYQNLLFLLYAPGCIHRH